MKPNFKNVFTGNFALDLGSHFASNKIFWNEEEDKKLVCNLAKRYYAEIMMPFRTTIKNHLEKLRNYDIKMIAPQPWNSL